MQLAQKKINIHMTGYLTIQAIQEKYFYKNWNKTSEVIGRNVTLHKTYSLHAIYETKE